MSNNPHNPYGKAAGAYSSTASSTDQRSMEGYALLKAAQKLESLSTRLAAKEKIPLEEIQDTFDYNRKLWVLFVSETMNMDHPLPQDIRNNIASLGVFVFKRTTEALIETTPEKIKALIDINRNIAAGLMKQPKGAQPPASAPPKGSAGKSSTDSMA